MSHKRRIRTTFTIPKAFVIYVAVIGLAFIGLALIHTGIIDLSNLRISSFIEETADTLEELGETLSLTYNEEELELETFAAINSVREENGLNPFVWDDALYLLSKAHTQAMAERGRIFHSDDDLSYGENTWGGSGYYYYTPDELAEVIVDGWMSSPLHRAWLLHSPLRNTVVSIVITPDGQYASWTFWMGESGGGPELIVQIHNEWMRETGGNIPWIEWLRYKGYID